MVDEQIVARGVRDPLVIDAMRSVPRELFVAPAVAARAYSDEALPIEGGQTISQPYIVALMIEAIGLRGGETVLEIGTGSGYEAAVLGRVAGRVCTVERNGVLAAAARRRLERLGTVNVEVRHGDGTRGWPELAPFDAIVVSAGAPAVPGALREQLAIGGRMLIPVGSSRNTQRLLCIERRSEQRFARSALCAVRFVPLIGEGAWPDAGHDAGQSAEPSRSSRLSRVLRTLMPRRSRSSREGT